MARVRLIKEKTTHTTLVRVDFWMMAYPSGRYTDGEAKQNCIQRESHGTDTLKCVKAR